MPKVTKTHPDAPKRFKSSYICFSIAHQDKVKAELGPNARVADISKRMAQLWKGLSEEEKKKWDAEAKADRARYEEEKANYSGPWQAPQRRTKKDPSAPKRPMSAFLYFSQKYRPIVKAQKPDLKNTDVSKCLGEMWRNAPTEERNMYIDCEAQQRAKYKVDIAKWKQEQLAKAEAAPNEEGMMQFGVEKNLQQRKKKKASIKQSASDQLAALQKFVSVGQGLGDDTMSQMNALGAHPVGVGLDGAFEQGKGLEGLLERTQKMENTFVKLEPDRIGGVSKAEQVGEDIQLDKARQMGTDLLKAQLMQAAQEQARRQLETDFSSARQLEDFKSRQLETEVNQSGQLESDLSKQRELETGLSKEQEMELQINRARQSGGEFDKLKQNQVDFQAASAGLDLYSANNLAAGRVDPFAVGNIAAAGLGTGGFPAPAPMPVAGGTAGFSLSAGGPTTAGAGVDPFSLAGNAYAGAGLGTESLSGYGGENKSGAQEQALLAMQNQLQAGAAGSLSLRGGLESYGAGGYDSLGGAGLSEGAAASLGMGAAMGGMQGNFAGLGGLQNAVSWGQQGGGLSSLSGALQVNPSLGSALQGNHGFGGAFQGSAGLGGALQGNPGLGGALQGNVGLSGALQGNVGLGGSLQGNTGASLYGYSPSSAAAAQQIMEMMGNTTGMAGFGGAGGMGY